MPFICVQHATIKVVVCCTQLAFGPQLGRVRSARARNYPEVVPEQPRTDRSIRLLTWFAIVLAIAVLVTVVAAAYTGATTGPTSGISDAGPVVRWALAPVRAIHDLALACTIGVLLLTATVIPDDNGLTRRAAGLRLAAATSFVWAVSAVATVVLGLANVAGVPISDPDFPNILMSSAWELEVFRVYVIAAIAAAIIASAAVVVRSRGAVLTLLIVGLIGMAPLPLVAHAGGSANHETSVNALGAHLLGAAVWAGGLLALMAMRPLIEPVLGPVLRRFSVLATWCFFGVLMSGVLIASTRVGWSDLTTPYAVVLWVKVLALGGLGLIALAQRRKVVAVLTDDVAKPSAEVARKAFRKFTAYELVLLSIAFGAAAALSRSAPPIPQEAVNPSPALILTNYPVPPEPTIGSWFTAWRIDWLFLALCLLGIGLYAAGLVRLYRRGDRWPIGRTICWLSGWLLLFWVTNGALGIYGRVSFSWHMSGHMLEAMLIPMFWVLGAPITLLLRTVPPRHDGTWGVRELVLKFTHSRFVAFFSNPVVAGINFFASITFFYFSGVFELALTTHTGHLLMIAHFLLAGYMFSWVLIGVDPGPKKWSAPLRLIVLFATMSFHAFFGVAVMSMNSLLASDFFTAIKIPWIPDPLADQHVGGSIAWGVGEIPALALAILVTMAWLREDTHDSTRRDRKVDRDGDPELDAYNAQLARMAERDRQHAGE